MLRSSLIVAAAALLGATAAAQSQLPARNMVPTNVMPKHAGVVDVVTGKRAPATNKAVVNVFNNTCFYDRGTGFIYYGTTEYCMDGYDEGQIPSPDDTFWPTIAQANGGSGTGASTSVTLSAFEFTYCVWNVFAPGAGPDIEIAFWDNLGGECAGRVAPTGNTQGHWSKAFGTPGGGANAPAAYFDLSGLALPGSTAGGLDCWIVGITNLGSPVLQASGDGVFDNDESRDLFTWGFRNNDVPPSNSNGWLITGDAQGINSGGETTCTYDIPCGTDWLGFQCGSGYNSADLFWLNSDGGVGGGINCPTGPNTGCYFFGGYPTGNSGNFWMRIEADTGGGGNKQTYCTSKPSSIAGCTPSALCPDVPITKGAGGSITATFAPVPGGNKPALLIRGKALANPPINTGTFGFICIAPFNRSSLGFAVAGGTNNTCTGSYSWDLQAEINSAPPAQAGPGDSIYFQLWYRDPGFPPPNNANLTEACGAYSIL